MPTLPVHAAQVTRPSVSSTVKRYRPVTHASEYRLLGWNCLLCIGPILPGYLNLLQRWSNRVWRR